MVALPADIPVTVPATFTDATAAFDVPHVPLGVVLVSVVALPIHTVDVPPIAATAGAVPTVTVLVRAIIPQLLIMA
jgi:hypothetical protein